MRYGNFCALDNLNLDVQRGEICALLGPNGAGKSTTVKILAGLLKPTSGLATILDMNPKEAKRAVGVVPETLGLFDDLTVEEHLLLTADIYKIPKERVGQLVRLLSLRDARGTFARECSQGTRKKTSLAMALLQNPRVLLLDEPFETLDPAIARTVLELLRDAAHNRGITVMLTSHNFSITENLADQFAFIRAGKLVHTATADLPAKKLEELYFELIGPPVMEKLEWLGC
jgi:ABC-2 type transport system ATP-binding protein